MITRSAILGIGHYVPSKVVTNDDLAKMMSTSDEWIVQRTGIKERRFVEHGGIGASDLAVPACKAALERAGLEAKDVQMIIFATLSPDHNFPGSGCFLGHKLGLAGVPALDVRNQCSGFLYGLSVADAWVRAGVYDNILLVGAEVHSTGVEFTDRGRDVAVLFGDGAGAAVIGRAREANQGIKSIKLHADGSGAKDLWLEAPASAYEARLTPKMLVEGKHYPQMNGKSVFRWATEKMPEVAREVLADGGDAGRGRWISSCPLPGKPPHQPVRRPEARHPRREDRPQHRALRQHDRRDDPARAQRGVVSAGWVGAALRPRIERPLCGVQGAV